MSELPAWYTRKNFVLTAYQPPLQPRLRYLRLLFAWHNETVNVWTHLLAAWWHLQWLARLSGDDGAPLSAARAPAWLRLPLVAALAAQTLMFTLSATAHALSAASQRTFEVLWRIDQVRSPSPSPSPQARSSGPAPPRARLRAVSLLPTCRSDADPVALIRVCTAPCACLGALSLTLSHTHARARAHTHFLSLTHSLSLTLTHSHSQMGIVLSIYGAAMAPTLLSLACSSQRLSAFVKGSTLLFVGAELAMTQAR